MPLSRFMCLALIALACTPGAQDRSLPAAQREWRAYLGDPERSHYSPLRQIHRENVDTLEVVWRYAASEPSHGGEMQCNPLIIDGWLYATSPQLRVFALDAATGQERWSFDPFADGQGGQGRNRGLAYWSDGVERRLLVTAGGAQHQGDCVRTQLFADSAEKTLPGWFLQDAVVELTDELAEGVINLHCRQ